MNNKLRASASIEINTSSESVWDALTNPEKIKAYLFGTETITDWKVGSPIVFQGEYESHIYQDKGNVLEVVPNQLLRYNYWSSMSGLEDKIENYFIVTYLIEEVQEGKVKFTWNQEGFPTEERRAHTEKGLPGMLNQIKRISES
jgi:uncharacterized protein YndB with AHSA1/START domain